MQQSHATGNEFITLQILNEMDSSGFKICNQVHLYKLYYKLEELISDYNFLIQFNILLFFAL